MPSLTATPLLATVDPTRYEPLAQFTCGDTSDDRHRVNALVSELWKGETIPTTVRVAEYGDDNELIGLSAFVRLPMKPSPTGDDFDDEPEDLGYQPADRRKDDVCIAVIGVGARRQGSLLPESEVRLGEFLLKDALQQIGDAYAKPGTPPIWALVGLGNQAAIDLCNSHDFELNPLGGDFYLALRPPTDH